MSHGGLCRNSRRNQLLVGGIDFGRRVIRKLEIKVDGTNAGTRDSYIGLSAVGLAEVGIGDVHVDEVVRLPNDLLATAGFIELD